MTADQSELLVPPPDSSTSGSGPRNWVLMVASLSVAAIAVALPQSMLFSVMPALGSAVGASPSAIGWLLTGFLVTSAAALPLTAQMGELYGNRRTLAITLIIAALGESLAACSQHILPMIVGMCLGGVGFGAYPVSYALIGEHLDDRHRGFAVGVLGASLLIGITLAGMLTGPIIEYLSYHWVFWVCAIALVTGLLCVHVFVPESTRRPEGRIDWAGALLLGAAAGAVMIAVAQAPVWGWTSPATIGVALAGLIGLVLWVPVERRVERRGHMPAISVKTLMQPAVAIATAMAVAATFVLYAFSLIVAYFVEVPTSVSYGFGWTVTQTTHLLFVNGAAGAVASLSAGYLDRKFDPKWLCGLGGILVGPASFLPLAVMHQSVWQVYLFSVVGGLGMGMVTVAIINVVLRAVREEDTGPATGINLIAQSIGGALGVSLTTEILTAGIDAATQVPTETAFTLAWCVSAGVGALVILLSLVLVRVTRRTRPRP